MATEFWPGTKIVRSRGNGFDLEAKIAQGSIFLPEAKPVRAKRVVKKAKASAKAATKARTPDPSESCPGGFFQSREALDMGKS